MKTITHYECEICGRRYTTTEGAEGCEGNEPAPEYPIGMIHGNNHPGAFYEGMVFAVAENCPEGHANYVGIWACRDDGRGDSLGQNLCQAPHSRLCEGDGHTNPDMPAFQRMVTYLTDRLELRDPQQEIQVWDGNQPIPVQQYLELHRQRTAKEVA